LALTSELHAMLSDATSALAHLDADTLENLTLRALVVERRGQRSVPAASAPALTARLRVFAAAMQATRNNLEFMNAITHVTGDGAGSRGQRWDR